MKIEFCPAKDAFYFGSFSELKKAVLDAGNKILHHHGDLFISYDQLRDAINSFALPNEYGQSPDSASEDYTLSVHEYGSDFWKKGNVIERAELDRAIKNNGVLIKIRLEYDKVMGEATCTFSKFTAESQK